MDEPITAADLYNLEHSQHRLLSLEEERTCLERIHAGDRDALEELVRLNQRLVATIALRYHNSAISGIGVQKLEWLDLVQVGNIGLLHAIRKFDLERRSRFSTYATWWIRQYIRRYCVVSSGVFSVSYRQGDVQATQSKSDLFIKPGVVYLDAPRGPDNETPMEEIISGGDGVEEAAGNRVDYQLALDMIERLDPRARHALALRFGLGGQREHTYAQIAARLGVSNITAASIVKTALHKLRAGIEQAGDAA